MNTNKDFSWIFNTVSNSYDKMRPGYPEELYNDIFKYVDINQNSNVLEVEIGTGQASLPLIKTDCNFIAVEYGDNLAKISKDKSSNNH